MLKVGIVNIADIIDVADIDTDITDIAIDITDIAEGVIGVSCDRA